MAQAQPPHSREFWRSIANNHYAVPESEQPFPLALELSGYVASPDPELRDDLAYSILDSWLVRQRLLSKRELLTLMQQWQGNLRAGIGEKATDSVFRRSFSALNLAALAERNLKDPFLEEAQFRSLLNDALTYLRDERDLRGFDSTKGWIHATAHTADLLAALAQDRLFTKQDQAGVLAAITQRLATAGEVFTYGEQDRLANAAAVVIASKDFDAPAAATWLKQINTEDQTVWKKSPPDIIALTRFENDSYFLRALSAQIASCPPPPAEAEAQKTLADILRTR